MKNKDKWKASKYVYRKGRLIGSRNPKELGIGSRLIGDIIASLFGTYIPKYAKGKLLDLGCGKVPLFEVYKDYVTDNICVDWKNTLRKNEYLDYEFDLNEKIPFNNGEFDTIILSDVLEHIPQPEKLWQEMSRILGPGGKIIMNTPFYYWVHEAPYDYYRYTKYSLKRFVNLTGFKLLLLIPIGGAPEILTDIIAKNSLRLPLLGKPFAIMMQYIMYRMLKVKIVKKISNVTANDFPFGYFLVAEKI